MSSFIGRILSRVRANMPAMTTEPTQAFVTTPDGIELAHYDWGGASDAQPVLLAHPTGFHGRVWQPVAVQLRDAGFHCFALDFRGHGDSGRPTNGYAWSGFATDVRTVADALGLAGDPHCIAVGLSKGGAALMLAELDAPGTFAQLWCYEPIVFPFDPPPPVGPDFPLAVAARKRRATWPSLEEARATYAAKPPLNALHADALDAYVTYGLRHIAGGEWALTCRPEDEAEMYLMGMQHGGYARLGSLHAPTVVACGEHTDALIPTFAAQLVERLPHGTLDVWAGAGHFGPLEDPERCVAAIAALR
jgi:pimeloyl-ACP methyl ester carboxylesterase